mmetsp:Transcript_15379/g.35989  ORF Transcript_15379/g.35989 Transcript_15379/m.35989 type:complete len:534 (-) Transcript_15379:7-1608(-)
MESHGRGKEEPSLNVVHLRVLVATPLHYHLLRRLPGVAEGRQDEARAHGVDQVGRDDHDRHRRNDPHVEAVDLQREVERFPPGLGKEGGDDHGHGEPLEGVQDHDDHDARQRGHGDVVEQWVAPQHAGQDAQRRDRRPEAAGATVEAVDGGEAYHGITPHTPEEAGDNIGDSSGQADSRSVGGRLEEVVDHLSGQEPLHDACNGQQEALQKDLPCVVHADEAHVIVLVQEERVGVGQRELLHVADDVGAPTRVARDDKLDEHGGDNGKKRRGQQLRKPAGHLGHKLHDEHGRYHLKKHPPELLASDPALVAIVPLFEGVQLRVANHYREAIAEAQHHRGGNEANEFVSTGEPDQQHEASTDHDGREEELDPLAVASRHCGFGDQRRDDRRKRSFGAVDHARAPTEDAADEPDDPRSMDRNGRLDVRHEGKRDGLGNLGKADGDAKSHLGLHKADLFRGAHGPPTVDVEELLPRVGAAEPEKPAARVRRWRWLPHSWSPCCQRSVHHDHCSFSARPGQRADPPWLAGSLCKGGA